LFFFISSLVNFYRDDYIQGDLNINRFILMVLLFVLSMMFIIIRPNMISILLGWDGLGLVSDWPANLTEKESCVLSEVSNRRS
jgi:NADH:ubiquinone oxidoreductase subunit 5 (subunit L)/multisubunit Na+/H+ antiporter MnhA subunit